MHNTLRYPGLLFLNLRPSACICGCKFSQQRMMGFFAALFIIFRRFVVRVKCPLFTCTQEIRGSCGRCPILIDFARIMPRLEYMVFFCINACQGSRANCRHTPGSSAVGVEGEGGTEGLILGRVPVRFLPVLVDKG